MTALKYIPLILNERPQAEQRQYQRSCGSILQTYQFYLEEWVEKIHVLYSKIAAETFLEAQSIINVSFSQVCQKTLHRWHLLSNAFQKLQRLVYVYNSRDGLYADSAKNWPEELNDSDVNRSLKENLIRCFKQDFEINEDSDIESDAEFFDRESNENLDEVSNPESDTYLEEVFDTELNEDRNESVPL